MIPELKAHYDHAKKEMDDAIDYLKREFSHVRAGKATTSLLDGVKVNYYGSQTPLNQLASVSAPEARLLMVQPYDKGSMQEIEKAIMSSGLGLNPNNDGSVIRIPLPMLTEERRQELVKHSRDVAEKARISIRNYRREANESINVMAAAIYNKMTVKEFKRMMMTYPSFGMDMKKMMKNKE
jgi:ribosome recycling factor